MTLTNVMPIRPGVEADLLAVEQETVAQTVWKLVSESRTGCVQIWLGAVQIGRIDVLDGVVRHAEIPGARGDVALELIHRLPGARASVGPYYEVEATVTVDWRPVLDPKGMLQRPEAPVIVAVTEPDDFGDLFRQATTAYVGRRYEEALDLFERCAALAPDDRRVAHNLRRLRERLG